MNYNSRNSFLPLEDCFYSCHMHASLLSKQSIFYNEKDNILIWVGWKTLFNIVMAPFKRWLNFDVCVVWWCSDGPVNSHEYKCIDFYLVTIKMSMAVFIIFPKSRNTFQYPLSKRVCKRLSKRLSRVAAFIIKLYREYESRGRPCHCAAALRSLTRRAEINRAHAFT